MGENGNVLFASEIETFGFDCAKGNTRPQRAILSVISWSENRQAGHGG
jgi:hypothetical protein